MTTFLCLGRGFSLGLDLLLHVITLISMRSVYYNHCCISFARDLLYNCNENSFHISLHKTLVNARSCVSIPVDISGIVFCVFPFHLRFHRKLI